MLEAGQDIIFFSAGGKNATYNVDMQVDNASDIFIIYTKLPANVPEQKRSSVSEYLTRANYGIVLGNFELDFRDGEVRFKCATEVKGSTLSREMIESMLGKSLYAVDMYFPGLMRLVYANLSAADAIRDIDPRQAEREGGAVEALAVRVLSECLGDSPSYEQEDRQAGQQTALAIQKAP